MKKKIKKLFTIVVIISVTYGIYFSLFETEWFRIKTINYNLDASMDIYVLERYSGIEYGDLYFFINTSKAEDNIEDHPFVKNATIEKVFPNQIDINLEYRKHFLNIMYSDIILSLDDSLQVLEVLDKPKDGYMVTGMAFNTYTTGKEIEVDELYILKNSVLLIDLIDQSHVTVDATINYDQNNIGVTVGSIKVNFGDGENIEERFNEFINIYDSLSQNGIKTGVIDVSTDGLPVYRPFGK